MPKKRFSAEQIVTVLRQIEVLMSQGKAAPVACREGGIQQLRDECLNGDYLQSEGGDCRHRAMAQPLQHDPTALIFGLPAARTANILANNAHLNRSTAMQ